MATGGFGVLFYIGDDEMSTTPTYTAVADLEDISPVGGKSIMDEITAHDSTEGFREKVATGLFEVDDVELTLTHNLTVATQANAVGGLLYNWKNKIKTAYKIVMPGTMTWEFDAYISEWKVTALKDKALRSNMKMTVTGKPTIT